MKRYYNSTTNRYYTEGNSITIKPNKSSIFSGVPTEKQLKEWGFEEYVEPVVDTPVYTPTYEDLVVQKIRERYTIDDEFAIQRQKEEKPVEWEAYYTYCEQCKDDAKRQLGINAGAGNDE